MFNPRVFVGSSTEGLKVAKALKLKLQCDARIELWDEGTFRPGYTILESLSRSAERCDFAIFVMTADDLLRSRDATWLCARDNILFEVGLFMGKIGRFRTFVVCEADEDFKVPEDLKGLNFEKLPRRNGNSIETALTPTCENIRRAIKGDNLLLIRMCVQLFRRRRRHIMMLGFFISLILALYLGYERGVSDTLKKSIAEKMRTFNEHQDPNLEPIFGDDIYDFLTNVENFVAKGEFHVDSMDKFLKYYRNTLEANEYRGATFLATGLPYPGYFNYEKMQDPMKEFINNQGTIKRIFYIHSLEDLNNKDVKKMLNDQCKIGVEVYTADASKLGDFPKDFFVVEEKERIAWRGHTGMGDKLESIDYTSGNKDVRRCKRIFNDLLKKKDVVRRYNQS